jgi:hypothetical protein
MSESKKTNPRVKPIVAPLDIAIGGGFVAVGIAFLALVFMRGSDDTLITNIKSEAKTWGRRIL